MNDPRRFLDGGGSELERLLLASGRSVGPGRMAKARTGVVLWLVGMGFAPSLFATIRTTMRPWLFARWVAVGLGTGAAAWGTVRVASHVYPPAAVAPMVAQTRSARPAVNPGQAEVSEPTLRDGQPDVVAPGESPSDLPETASKGAASTGSPAPTSLLRGNSDAAQSSKGSVAAEIRELDAARRSIEEGDPRGALHRLDHYAKAHPKGAFEQEQIRLRIEALVALGETDSARALTRKFLARYPESAYRKRLQTLVGGRP